MSTNQNHCQVCGKPEYSDAEMERVRADPEYLPTEGNPLHSGRCWGCLTLAEQRYDADQCGRCGSDFYGEDGDEQDGWYWPGGTFGEYICPSCQTSEDHERCLEDYIVMMEDGKRRAEAEGREYPRDLEMIVKRNQIWLANRLAEIEDLNQQVGF